MSPPSATPPAPYTLDFLTWRSQRVSYFVELAKNSEVDTIYYLADDGSDSNNGLSPATPKQTLANVQSLLSGGQRVEIRLKRGSVFSGGISIPSSGTFKITAYGNSADPKPVVTMFTSSGYLSSDTPWSADSGNRYVKTISPITAIGWIRDKNDPYNPYTYLTTSANVALLPYSWTQVNTSATFTVNTSTERATSSGHGLSDGDLIFLTTTGTLPAPLVTRRNYYVKLVDANTFEFAETPGGATVNLTTTGSGTQTWNKPGALYINAGGTDPNTLDYEVMPDFNDHTQGWSSNSNGAGNYYYLADVVFEGHGVSPYQDASRGVYNVHPGVCGSDVFVGERVEGYYNGRHALGHTNGASDGGVFVLKDCAAGYGSIDSTSYVSFSGGNDLESHYEGCFNPFGKLPSDGYASIVGPVWPGGPAHSGVYAHTAGGLLGLITVWDHDFQDNRASYSRATYEIGDITASDLPGTATDIDSLRAFFHHRPIERLVETEPATVTVNATTDMVNHAGNPYVDGDLVELSATVTIPGGITARRTYGVINRDNDGYQLAVENINITATGVDPSTDTLTCISATAFSNGSRVKIIAEYGQLPGGLDPNILYYVINLSGANLQLSLTSGGSAVDITDTGFGRFRLYGNIVNITSTGSGTITAVGVKPGLSAFVRVSQSVRAVYINTMKVGLQSANYGGASVTTSLNQINYQVNTGLATTGLTSGGGRHYNGHFALRGRGSFAYLNVSNSADAVLFNSIFALQSFLTAFNVTDATSNQRGNAYWNPSNNATLNAATTADDYKVNLSARPIIGAPPTSQIDTEGYPSPLGIALEYDFRESRRNTVTPSIGPIAAPSDSGGLLLVGIGS